MVESVDTRDLKSLVRKGVPVQVWPGAPYLAKARSNFVARLGHAALSASLAGSTKFFEEIFPLSTHAINLGAQLAHATLSASLAGSAILAYTY